ncbi:protein MICRORCHIDIA 6-like isoform X2 [Camellia sinensis]|uniref:protein MICRORCHIDIA 6-like isoform X2 n=1 Tax=Camellia sinensis TaxID=4442 RepID=UPI001035FCDC|nr:protein MICRORCHIDIA 6-like isoform X2 [Camellia sinensis]
MNSADFVELSNDDKIGESSGTDSKKGLDSVLGTTELKGNTKSKKVYRKSKTQSARQKSEESRSSVAHSVSRNDSSVLDQGCSTVDESGPSSVPSFCPAPICRQFWKAGNYDTGQGYKTQLKNGKNHLRVHPMFLHSNATSHKWAFGAIAELLDNAVDEIQNGATFVVIDKTTNPRDGNPALLIQDDGGGMDPETIRRCMSFGFSDKKMKSAIGQYGNGFKTSSMRLGADVVVCTRHLRERTLTQSVGLLSYTFLRQTGHDRIVVPLVDYEFNESTTKLEPILSYGKEHFSSNLSVLLQWSPYLTEEIMLKQFDDIGNHGTKIVIYNLWLNDNGDMELDFDLDAEDIRVIADPKLLQTGCRPNQVSDQHIANLYHYSLRVYSSILYLRVPQSFKIVLRGRVVEHHNIANDLKFPEFILYKPHGGNMEQRGDFDHHSRLRLRHRDRLRPSSSTSTSTQRSTSTLTSTQRSPSSSTSTHGIGYNFFAFREAVVTTIGFLKEAPRVNIHGFNVYYKNRLILYLLWQPFWRVVKETTSSHGRGIYFVGVLEANFVEPTHNKQDFEKTSLFQKLEARLKEMTLEYWNFHCGLIGYQQMKKSPPAPKPSQETRSFRAHSFIEQPVLLNHRSSVTDNAGPLSSAVESFEDTVATPSKRKEQNPAGELEHVKRHTGSRSYSTDTQHIGVNQPTPEYENQLQDDEFTSLMQENEKLQTQLLELERSEECLTLKVRQLRKELGDIQSEYARLVAESESMNIVKDEKTING